MRSDGFFASYQQPLGRICSLYVFRSSFVTDYAFYQYLNGVFDRELIDVHP